MSTNETEPIMTLETMWTRKDLQGVFKVSGRTIDRLVALGCFPAPVHIGRCCRWRASHIEQFLKQAEGKPELSAK